MKLRRDWGGFARPLERRGQTRFVTPEEARTLFPPVYEALRRERPGVPSRSEKWWELRQTRMPEEYASSPKRFVALELDGETQGYAIFRIHNSFEAGVTTSRIEVLEAIGATPQATAEIWRFLIDIDWTQTVEMDLLPPDHPLFLLLANPRRAGYHMMDGVWVRLVDVGAALAGREYASEGSVVFEVRDAFCPWNEGRWKLESGKAARTDEPAEIALDVDALGSAFLGAVSFSQMRDALRIEELVDGAVHRADAIFEWRPLPWCPEIY
jgi:predicted acetyltransferase